MQVEYSIQEVKRVLNKIKIANPHMKYFTAKGIVFKYYRIVVVRDDHEFIKRNVLKDDIDGIEEFFELIEEFVNYEF